MKTMSIKWVLVAFAGLFFVSCGSTAHIEKDMKTDFSKYRTYAWVNKPLIKEEKKRKGFDLTERNIRNSVNEELQKKGWKETKSRPDVLVNFELLVEKNQVEKQDPVYTQSYTRSYYSRRTGRVHTFYYPSEFIGYDSYSTTVKEGTVTITMIDSRTDRTVWQGLTTAEMNGRNITSREIDRNVKTIFKKFDAGR